MVLNATAFTNQPTMWISAATTGQSATSVSMQEHDPGLGASAWHVHNVQSLSIVHACRALESRPKWADKEYREGYVDAAIEQGAAWQIRANRKARGWTQEQLAQKLGTQQSAISRLEDPQYGKHSLDTLVAVSHVFDCALSVKFIPFSILAAESADLSEESMVVKSYQQELFELEQLNARPSVIK